MQLIPTVLRFPNATILIQNKQQKQQKLIDIYFMINCSNEFLLKDTLASYIFSSSKETRLSNEMKRQRGRHGW